MKSSIYNFLKSEDGAITVDWVALTAGVIGVIVVLYSAVQDDTVGLADRVGDYMGSQGSY